MTMKFFSHIGLDIGSSTVKLVQLGKSGGQFHLEAIAIAQTPQGLEGVSRDAAEIDVVKKLAKDSGASSKQVAVSLPEAQVYTRVIEMPFLEEPDLSSTIKWQAEQYIPVPLSEVVLKHQVLNFPKTGVPGAKMAVLLVAAPRLLIDHYMSVLSRAGLEIVAIETEIFAAARALVSTDALSPTTLLVNLGTDNTTFAVLSGGELSLTQSVGTGGMAMTRALMSGLGVEAAQADQYKKVYGLDRSGLEGKVVAAVQPVIDVLAAEMKKVTAYYETRAGASPIKRVILSGGAAVMRGLVEYVAALMNMEVQLGNPFRRMILSDRQKEAVLDAGPIFAASAGLAMKEL